MIRWVLCLMLLSASAWADGIRIVGGDTFWTAALTGSARAIDGDTLVIAGQHIRLAGIDAPESKQSCERAGQSYACGQEATAAMREMIQGQAISCTATGHDRYSRLIATCATDNIPDLGARMVEMGHALDYRQYSHGAYAVQETRARTAKVGMWAGTFTAPWDWRHHK